VSDTKDKPKRHNPLKPADKLILKAYVDPNSPTFSNGRKSAHSVLPHLTEGSATQKMTHLLRKPQAISETERILEELGYGYEVRIREIAKNAAGGEPEEVVTVTTNKDGEKTTQVTTRRVPHTARVQYFKLMADLTGDRERAKAIGKREGDDLYKASQDILRRIKGTEVAEDAEIVYETHEESHHATQPADMDNPHTDSNGNPFTGRCYHCDCVLPPGSHKLKRYCSDDCRVAAMMLRRMAQKADHARTRADESTHTPAPTEASAHGNGGQWGESGKLLPIPSPPLHSSEKNSGGALWEALKGMSVEERRELGRMLLEEVEDDGGVGSGVDSV